MMTPILIAIRKIYEAFVESVERHNGDASVNLNIDSERNAQWRKCTSDMQGSNFDDFQKCRRQADSFVGAKYGDAIGQFYCNIQLKGTSYPILVYSRCSVTASNEMRYDNRFELTDINAFEPSTIEQGLIRMLDEHVRNLSKVFALAAKCD